MVCETGWNKLAIKANATKFTYIFGTQREYEEKVQRKQVLLLVFGNIKIMKLKFHIVAC